MKYDKLSIFGFPKTFNLWDACDSFQPAGKVASPDDILFDMYPAECNEGKMMVRAWKRHSDARNSDIIRSFGVKERRCA